MDGAFVSQAKRLQLQQKMALFGLREEDLLERFVLGSGSGGQKVNKTSSCVYLKHLPTGRDTKCNRSRHRELNRYLARQELCDQMETAIKGAASKRQMAAEKIRRQKRRRSRRQKEKMLVSKHRQSEKKQLRGSVQKACGDE